MSKPYLFLPGRAVLVVAICAVLRTSAWAGGPDPQSPSPQSPSPVGAGDSAHRAGRGGQARPTSYSPWQWICLGLGVTLVAGGVTSMVLGFADDSKADDGWRANPPSLTAEAYRELKDTAQTKKSVGYVLTGVGGAALVTGAVLLALDLLSHEAAERLASRGSPVALSMVPLAGGGGASVALRF